MNNFNKYKTLLFGVFFWTILNASAQNAMVGDGFGGNSYSTTNYAPGGLGGFAVCNADKQLYVWGGDFFGAWGEGGAFYTNNTKNTVKALAVPNMNNVIYFNTDGIAHAAIKADRTGWVWGLGNQSSVLIAPTQVVNDAYFVTSSSTIVYSGIYPTVMFVKTDGTVWSVGYNNAGEFGNGMMNYNGGRDLVAKKMNDVSSAVRVASGINMSLILLRDGTVLQTGSSVGTGAVARANSDGTYATYLNGTTPVVVRDLPKNIVDIKVVFTLALALTSTGEVYAWGNDQNRMTGVSTTSNPNIYKPIKINYPAPIKAISAFDVYLLALATNGDVYASGQNASGVMGTSAVAVNTWQSTPIKTASNVKSIMAGYRHSYILKNDNTLWGAGTNEATPSNFFFNLSGPYTTAYTQLTPTATSVGLCAPTAVSSNLLCNAGSTSPTLSSRTPSNVCPATTVDLNSLHTGTVPTGSTLVWSIHKSPYSSSDTLSNPTAIATAGTYYAMYYDKANACYSPADSATITSFTNCIPPLTVSTPAAQTATTGQAKTGNAATELAPTGGVSPYTYSNGAGDAACVAPSGATALPASSNLTVNSTTGAYTYTAPTVAGTYYYCIKVCDSATPTASCVVKTYTLTVSANPLTTNTPAAQTASVGAAKTGNAATELAPTGGVSPYIYSDGTGDAACVAPSGATALPASSNLTVNSSTGAYTYTAPTAAGTYYYCIKVCDSATPTADCVVKTYTLTVTAAACTVTGITPTFIKN